MSAGRAIRWLHENRTTARLAFLMQLGVRVLTSLLSLIWIPLFVGAIGKTLNSNIIAFQQLISLGGLGDLGMGGAVSIRAGQMLGERKDSELRRFLASARTVFLALAVVAGVVLLLLSPLHKSLGFDESPGTGSFAALFAVGAVIVVFVILSSYMTGVNYACGNVTWPIIPAFLLVQAGLLGHLLLARQHQPLWIQFLPYAVTAAAGLCLTRLYVKASHPALAEVVPLRMEWKMGAILFESTFWAYLCSLGSAIYRSTDGLVINAGFPGALTDYTYNYKLCEIVVFVVVSASLVSMPRITQWMASPHAAEQNRVKTELRRLNQFQTLLGLAGALAYLAGNNLFVRVWWSRNADPVVPAETLIQIAFALNMAVTAGGDAGIQVAGRTGSRGLRVAGLLLGITGLLNLGLSIWAMKNGKLWGIAMATVLAQTLLGLAAIWYVARQMKTPWLPWAARGCLLPVAGIGLAAWLRHLLPPDTVRNILLLSAAYAVMLLVAAWLLGVTVAAVREELKILRGFLPKSRG